MAQSMNTRVDLSIPATSFLMGSSYGKILIGDKAFEFYNDRNVEDYIQIPWEEIDYIAASVIMRKKLINRFVIFTKKNGKFSFSARDNKLVLRTVRNYIPEDRLVKSDTFLGVITRGIKSLFSRLFKK